MLSYGRIRGATGMTCENSFNMSTMKQAGDSSKNTEQIKTFFLFKFNYLLGHNKEIPYLRL